MPYRLNTQVLSAAADAFLALPLRLVLIEEPRSHAEPAESLIRGSCEVVGCATTASEGMVLLERLADGQGFSDAAAANLLSPREREVVELLSRGLTGEQIAVELVLSSETVKTHIRNAMTKLQATTRVHAIAIAIRLGYIGGPHPRACPGPADTAAASAGDPLPDVPAPAPLPA